VFPYEHSPSSVDERYSSLSCLTTAFEQLRINTIEILGRPTQGSATINESLMMRCCRGSLEAKSGLADAAEVKSMSGWERPVENSIAAIKHGMNHHDGVEFDLRLAADGELVLFHDARLPDAVLQKHGLNRYVELNDSQSLTKMGIERFSELVATKEFTTPWQEQPKVACIELKMPHPSSGLGGGWRTGTALVSYMSSMLKKVDELIKPLDLAQNNSVIFSFHDRVRAAAHQADYTGRLATLKPHIRPWGSSWMQRWRAFPSFVSTSVPRLIGQQRAWGSPLVPVALDYLTPPTNMLPIGTTVGLSGKHLEKLTLKRAGFPVYVWPAPAEKETALLSAGLTCISDQTSPEMYTLPTGTARWPRPATQPLNQEAQLQLVGCDPEDHAATLREMDSEVSPWSELGDSERSDLLTAWRSRWSWGRELDDLLQEADDNSMPWEVSRIVGHRGSGRD
jgi:glycerophosphoryl diester phosphodiesterase